MVEAIYFVDYTASRSSNQWDRHDQTKVNTKTGTHQIDRDVSTMTIMCSVIAIEFDVKSLEL